MKQHLLELTRREILSKGEREDPAKYKRRMQYAKSFKPLAMAKDLFIQTGTLTVPISVGDYIVTVHISGIIKRIKDEMEKANVKVPNRQITYAALRKAVDESNMYVNCTCPDFRYRHAYWATMNDYKYGGAETRPAKITNPNNKGSVCKHISAAIARPSQWLKYVAGWISTIVKFYIEREMELADDEQDIEIDVDEVEDDDTKDIEVSADEIDVDDEVDDNGDTVQ